MCIGSEDDDFDHDIADHKDETDREDDTNNEDIDETEWDTISNTTPPIKTVKTGYMVCWKIPRDMQVSLQHCIWSRHSFSIMEASFSAYDLIKCEDQSSFTMNNRCLTFKLNTPLLDLCLVVVDFMKKQIVIASKCLDIKIRSVLLIFSWK